MDGGDPLNPHQARNKSCKPLRRLLRGDYQQASFPDIVVVVGRDEHGNEIPCEGKPAIYLVESHYTEDCNVHTVARGIAMTQHSRLWTHLRQIWPGWNVQILPMVFGSFGTVRTETEQRLSTLGVADQDLKALLETVYTSSIEYTVRILQVHKEPSGYATATETCKRKALHTLKRRKCQKRSRQKQHHHDSGDCFDDLAREPEPQGCSQLCHSMRTRSRKRAVHVTKLHSAAVPEQQLTRTRR